MSTKCALAKSSRLHPNLGPFDSIITSTVLTLKALAAPDHILANKTNLFPQVHHVLANATVSLTLPHFQNQMLGFPVIWP